MVGEIYGLINEAAPTIEPREYISWASSVCVAAENSVLTK